MSRDYILHKVRTAVGRSAGQPPDPPPEPRLRVPELSTEQRIEMFRARLESLAGRVAVVGAPSEAREYVAAMAAGKRAVASNAPFLTACGITSIPEVRSGFREPKALLDACTAADVGITSADYALADTGTLVMLSSQEEARAVSLLPPVHVAVIRRESLLTGLDELFSLVPEPDTLSSSMVLITGPSRTADIEQILVRGVHGPGEIHVVIV